MEVAWETGLIAGILLVVVIIAGIIFVNGGFNFKGSKDVNLNVELPKAPATGKE